MQGKMLSVICVTPLLFYSNAISAEIWSLQSSIERAAQHAPEIKLAENEIEARQAIVSNSSFWPNPTIDARIDNKLGLEDGSGGYDVNEIGITQPIPINRLKHQKDFAQANTKVAVQELGVQQLMLEATVAKEFHALQFAQAEYRLAKERLAMAEDIQAKSSQNKQGVIVRYMTPLEKMRLNIIRQEAMQIESGAEGEYNEALSRFMKRLNLDSHPADSTPEKIAADLEAMTSLPEFNYFLEQQKAHASLLAQQQAIIASRAEIDVEKSRRINDPELRLSRSVDYFSQGEDVVYGLTLNVQIPLWSNNNPDVARAKYNVSQLQIEMQKTARELQTQLKQSHTHLGHLIQQAEHHQQKVLQPSAEILKLTNKGFVSGELGLLSLIDANNTYFDAQLRYSELLYQAWNEYADLRLAAGILYSKNSAMSNSTVQGAM